MCMDCVCGWFLSFSRQFFAKIWIFSLWKRSPISRQILYLFWSKFQKQGKISPSWNAFGAVRSCGTCAQKSALKWYLRSSGCTELASVLCWCLRCSIWRCNVMRSSCHTLYWLRSRVVSLKGLRSCARTPPFLVASSFGLRILQTEMKEHLENSNKTCYWWSSLEKLQRGKVERWDVKKSSCWTSYKDAGNQWNAKCMIKRHWQPEGQYKLTVHSSVQQNQKRFVTWAQQMKMESNTFEKNCVYLCPTWFEIYVVSHCSKFTVKVNFSSGGCQKLPNWVKITHQNADMPQFVSILQQVLKKKNYNLFYSIMQL